MHSCLDSTVACHLARLPQWRCWSSSRPAYVSATFCIIECRSRWRLGPTFSKDHFRGPNPRFDWALRLGPCLAMVHATVLRISGEQTLTIALLEEIAGAVIRVPIFILTDRDVVFWHSLL